MSAILNSHLLWDVLWQSTLFLGMGGLCSYLFRQRPSRAHRILLLSLLACLVTPFLSQVVRSHNWGMLPEATPVLQPDPATVADPIGELAPLRQDELSSPAAVSMDSPSHRTNPAIPTATLPPIRSVQTRGEISWQAGFLGLWSILTSLVLINVLIGVVQELYTLRDAHEIQDGDCDWLLKEAVRKLGLKTRPRVYSSSHVKSPMVCCWGMRPRLILPDTLLTQPSAMNLGGILCHELAHWKRRDHLTTLMSLIGLALLPWHPLMLWVKRRMSQLSEMSCDHWVLACGYPPETYAESLLKLQPHKSSITVLPAVSARKNLENRLKSILDSNSYRPHIGGKWNLVSTALTIALVSTMAFAKAPVSSPATEEISNSISEVSSTTTEKNERDSQQNSYSTVLEAGYTLRQYPKDSMNLWKPSAPTSDGKYVVGMKDRNVQLLDLTSGETRPITTDGYSKNQAVAYPEECVLSPNEKMVAYNWVVSSATENQKCQLRVININGTDQRTLLADENYEWISVNQWTPESDAVLCDVWDLGQKTGEVALISILDGSRTNYFKTEKGFSFYLTPDRKYILFNEGENKNYDILCYSVVDQATSPIVVASSSDRLIELSPDGKWMIFTSNRLGTTDLWIMPIERIHSENVSPILVKKSIGYLMSAHMGSSNGFYYMEQLNLSNIFCMDVDWNAHILKENPSAISASIKSDNKENGRWSLKGDEIAFEVEEDMGKTLHIYSSEDQKVRSVPGLVEWDDWSWSLDGKSLNVWGSHKGSKKGIYRVDSHTGEREAIRVHPDHDLWFTAAFSSCPEMKTLYNTWRVNDNLFRFYTYDVETDELKVLFERTTSNETFVFFERSPDGKWLACLHWIEGAGNVCLISTETGEIRDFSKKSEFWIGDNFLSWLPDSRSIVFTYLENNSTKVCTLNRLDIESNDLETIWTFEPDTYVSGIHIHPFGDKILYTKFQQENRYYGLENFLPNL